MLGGGSVSPATPLSPRTKNRSTSNSQPLNMAKYSSYNAAIPLSSESSSVSTIKLNDSAYSSTMLPSSNYNLATHASNSTTASNATKQANGTASIVVNGVSHNVVVVSNAEADSGRASMASNVDQDQCSPTFPQRAFILNRCKNFLETLEIKKLGLNFDKSD